MLLTPRVSLPTTSIKMKHKWVFKFGRILFLNYSLLSVLFVWVSVSLDRCVIYGWPPEKSSTPWHCVVSGCG